MKYNKRRPSRKYAIRKPRDYPAEQPGDLVQVDTLDVHPLDAAAVKHFTARDVISRWDVLEAHERATARTATEFLNTLLARMPFKVKAIQVDGSSPTLDYLTILGNSASGDGGVIFSTGGEPNIGGVLFKNNNAGLDGGGMYNSASSPLMGLGNSTFTDNSAYNGGGFFDINSDHPHIGNDTFYNNTATHYGGGLMFSNTSVPMVDFITTSGNTASAGNGIYFASGTSPGLTDSIIWDGLYTSATDPIFDYNDISSGYSGGTGNLNVSPHLGSLGMYGGYTPTLPLLPGSPVLDKADPSGSMSPTDQRGVARPQGGARDMGAYEAGFILTITSGDNQGTPTSTAFSNPLAMNVSEIGGGPVNGGTITFTAPASGSSATLSGSAVTIASKAASVTATANTTAGIYTVTASAGIAADAAIFHLTNQVLGTLRAIPPARAAAPATPGGPAATSPMPSPSPRPARRSGSRPAPTCPGTHTPPPSN